MMLTYKALIATTSPNLNGNRFSREVLEHISKEEQQVPVIIDSPTGTPIGFTKTVDICNDGLIATMCLPVIDLEERWFAVPVGICNSKKKDIEEIDGIRVIKHMELLSIFLTRNPSDTTLTPIERGDENHS